MCEEASVQTRPQLAHYYNHFYLFDILLPKNSRKIVQNDRGVVELTKNMGNGGRTDNSDTADFPLYLY